VSVQHSCVPQNVISLFKVPELFRTSYKLLHEHLPLLVDTLCGKIKEMISQYEVNPVSVYKELHSYTQNNYIHIEIRAVRK